MATPELAKRWSWVAARSRGSCHDVDDSLCQDYGAAFQLAGVEGTYLLLAVADGAGSARHGGDGARILVRSLLARAARHLAQGGSLGSVDDEVVGTWVREIRTLIEVSACSRNASMRDFATTLVAALVGRECCLIVQVGDGACVLELDDELGWRVPIWPMNGEYANETYFVTDSPWPRIARVHLDGRVKRVAVLTDGIQRMVLHERQRIPHKPFFESVFAPLQTIDRPGRHRAMSRALRAYLESRTIREHSNDDKTLILALRTPELIHRR